MGRGLGGLQKLITFFSGWAGLQKLITDLDMKNGYKGGVRVGFIYIKDMYNNDVGKGEPMPMKLMKQNKGWRTLGRLFAS